MKNITLGRTGITVPQNAFGALPIQRAGKDTAVEILRAAFEGGMTFFDTARAYSDSEEKIGLSFGEIWNRPASMFECYRDEEGSTNDSVTGNEGLTVRERMIIATKTQAKTPEAFWEQLHKSLDLLKTDYIDIYQLHCVPQCYRPGDGTGMYECLQEAKEQGLIKHIGITTHKIEVAFEIVNSDLYETLQYPFSYLASPREIELVNLAKEKNVGFIAMKGLAGGLINNSKAAMAYMLQYDNVLPIWGIQKMSELKEWLAFMDEEPQMDEELKNFINKEQESLMGEFCRGCGYCMPCPVGIEINNCARMSLMLRRAPSKGWLSEENQAKMKKIEDCLHCGACKSRCPYELDTPRLLEDNYIDYQKVLSGEVNVGYED